jgi:hypothetical protein
VIVVKTDHCPEDSQYVGNYKNEGFGKVIYNPAFLKADENGRACVSLYEKPAPTDMKGTKLSGTLLLDYLAKQQHQEAVESETYRLVNNWVKVNAKWFRGNTFASQWGSIRSIAMQHKTKQELLHELFDKKRLKNGEEADDGYLSHGVAAEKWAEKGRRSKLEAFIKYELTDENAQIAIINLAAEMAKKCKEDR